MRIASLLLLGVMAAGAQAPVVFTRWIWDGVYTDEQAHRGERLYLIVCADCHRPDLSGRTDRPIPPPGTMARPGTPALKGRTFIAKWTDLSLGDLHERIRISMPQQAPGSLTRGQTADILAHLLKENGFGAGHDELPPDRDALATIRIGQY